VSHFFSDIPTEEMGPEDCSWTIGPDDDHPWRRSACLIAAVALLVLGGMAFHRWMNPVAPIVKVNIPVPIARSLATCPLGASGGTCTGDEINSETVTFPPVDNHLAQPQNGWIVPSRCYGIPGCFDWLPEDMRPKAKPNSKARRP
jgi:hypothetical protein